MPHPAASAVDRCHMQLSLKREALARERPSGGMTRRFHTELAKGQHQGVQPFTSLQGGLAR